MSHEEVARTSLPAETVSVAEVSEYSWAKRGGALSEHKLLPFIRYSTGVIGYLRLRQACSDDGVDRRIENQPDVRAGDLEIVV